MRLVALDFSPMRPVNVVFELHVVAHSIAELAHGQSIATSGAPHLREVSSRVFEESPVVDLFECAFWQKHFGKTLAEHSSKHDCLNCGDLPLALLDLEQGVATQRMLQLFVLCRVLGDFLSQYI